MMYNDTFRVVAVRSVLVAAAVCCLALQPSPLLAQGEQPAYEQGTSPFTKELEYRVNSELRPRLDVDGLRLELLRLEPKTTDYEAGKPIATTLILAFTNIRDGSARAVVVLLLEDEQGNALDRVECKPIRVGANDSVEERQKFRFQSDALSATRKLYLFLEVAR